jgi:hypothetical protein
MPRPARRSRWWIAAAAAVAGAGAIAAWLALGADGAAPPGDAAAGAAQRDGGVTDGPAGASDRAARLVDEAMAAAAAGDLRRAHTGLAEAYALDPRPATLLEFATVAFQTGRCREALQAARGVIAAVPGSPLAEAARTLLGQIGRCD